MDASFVIIAYNEGPRLERTLRSITAQEGLSDYEVLVVDDGSSDETPRIAERYSALDPSVRVIRHSVNRGRGAARATGIDAAAGRYVAMVDADIILPPSWYRTCRAAVAEADAVSGIPIPDGDVQFLYTRLRLRPRAASTTAIAGSNAFFRRAVFDSVRFDPSFRNGEDVAISHALAAAGLTTHALQHVTVDHEEGKGFLASVAWMYESGIGATRQLMTFREVRAPDVAFGSFIVVAVVAGGVAVAKRSLRPLAIPPAWIAAISTGHLRGKFFLRSERPGKVAGAIGLNSIMLSAYLAGRAVGVSRPAFIARSRHRRRAGQNRVQH
jgi:glycosyltransferase involved in cell wall biosynthesis